MACHPNEAPTFSTLNSACHLCISLMRHIQLHVTRDGGITASFQSRMQRAGAGVWFDLDRCTHLQPLALRAADTNTPCSMQDNDTSQPARRLDHATKGGGEPLPARTPDDIKSSLPCVCRRKAASPKPQQTGGSSSSRALAPPPPPPPRAEGGGQSLRSAATRG